MRRLSRHEIKVGDCLDVLPTLDPESVQCVVTSPPYWGLRDYGTAEWDGGDPDCDHSSPVSEKQASNTGSGTISQRDCPCGARRIDRQIGLESTPEEYVANLVSVFREVRRVLREDGTVWLNLGDSYVSTPRGNRPGDVSTSTLTNPGRQDQVPRPQGGSLSPPNPPGLKPKDLIGIPWRVALALQADGWWLRSAIVWHKPNPMPESVTDRPTSSYEHVFLLTKSERYFYDHEAIKEPPGVGRNKRNVWTITTKPYAEAHFATFPEDLVVPCVKAGTSERGCCAECGAQVGRVYERVDDRHWTERRSPRNDGDGSFPEPANQPVGWGPSCDCNAGAKPCTVLDPFAGAGTVGVVCAKETSRDFIGIELSEEYAGMARRRIGEALETPEARRPVDGLRRFLLE